MSIRLKRLVRDPFGFLSSAFQKTVTGPLRYGRRDDYAAEQYWSDRFRKYGASIKGPGDEGLSEAENLESYNEAAGIFRAVCGSLRIDFPRSNVLEIGCGTGFYTGIMRSLGVTTYTGVDITDVFFEQHATTFPGFHFTKLDVTTDRIEGRFDLVLIIDVLEHIVNSAKFEYAIRNIFDAVNPGGILLLGPVMERSRKRLFYLRSWSLEDVKRFSGNCTIDEPAPFREGFLLTIKKHRNK